jgi:S-adenosylmethionine/arginine decarboxylase-like enzyme
MWNQSLWCLYGCNREKLKDGAAISKLIADLANLLNLRMIGMPTIDDFKETGMMDAGVSVEVTVAEDMGGKQGKAKLDTSHIYVHTWPEYEYASVDVFSCQWFDVKIAERFLRKELGSGYSERFDIPRGVHVGLKESPDKKKFPRNIIAVFGVKKVKHTCTGTLKV